MGPAAPRKSPDKGKPRPPPSGPTSCRPRRVRTRRARSPAQGRANPEGRPLLPTASGFWQGLFGAHLPAGSRRLRRAARMALGSGSTTKGCPSPSNVTFSAPLPGQEHTTLKPGTFLVSEGLCEAKLLGEL